MYLLRTSSPRYVCNACRSTLNKTRTQAPNGSRLAQSLNKTPTSINVSRSTFTTSVRIAKDRNDVSAEDPEFAFLDNGMRSPTTPLGAEEEELLSHLETTAELQDSIESAQPVAPTKTTDDTELVVLSEPFESTESTESTPTPAPSPPTRDPTIPWYLRQSSSPPPPQQVIPIPDLPPNPPPLLRPLLSYLSQTAGLDDISLLDLRHLDPPPALGPALIMLICTARSEKHLHVSADRFSRWMRREHNLRANAAGLLGRNELKIKLRRKAKRMRMLANVGGVMADTGGNLDDGIRTGWICCTLGKMEAHPDDRSMYHREDEAFVGFRDVKPGVNVVVQMFTEEKRRETDLETLWGGVVRTRERNEREADERLKEIEGVEDVDEWLEREEREVDEGMDEGMDEEVAEKEEEEDHISKTRQREDVGTPVQPLRRPQWTPSDLFPEVSSAHSRRQLRRLHTVGLRQ